MFHRQVRSQPSVPATAAAVRTSLRRRSGRRRGLRVAGYSGLPAGSGSQRNVGPRPVAPSQEWPRRLSGMLDQAILRRLVAGFHGWPVSLPWRNLGPRRSVLGVPKLLEVRYRPNAWALSSRRFSEGNSGPRAHSFHRLGEILEYISRLGDHGPPIHGRSSQGTSQMDHRMLSVWSAFAEPRPYAPASPQGGETDDALYHYCLPRPPRPTVASSFIFRLCFGVCLLRRSIRDGRLGSAMPFSFGLDGSSRPARSPGQPHIRLAEGKWSDTMNRHSFSCILVQ